MTRSAWDMQWRAPYGDKFSIAPALTGLSGMGICIGPSGLLASLISYWKLEETSGTRYDSVVASANNLTDENTVTQGVGVNGNAAQLVSANLERLSIADNPSLSMGDIDFTIAVWANLDTNQAWATPIAKYTEYMVQRNGAGSYRFGVTHDGATFKYVDSLVTPSTATWYFIVAWHDSVANTINIQINNGTAQSAAHTLGVFNGTHFFALGDTEGAWFNGRLDEAAVWKRVLTATERTNLYNSGNGVTYPFTGVP